LDWTATGKLYLLGSGVFPIAATHERTVPKAGYGRHCDRYYQHDGLRCYRLLMKWKILITRAPGNLSILYRPRCTDLDPPCMNGKDLERSLTPGRKLDLLLSVKEAFFLFITTWTSRRGGSMRGDWERGEHHRQEQMSTIFDN
jgi:hypothetical protein